MKAAVLKQDGKLHYMDAPKPVLRHGEVLVRVRACGICGSDLRYLEGENPWAQQTLGYVTENPDNMILGHEFSGEVVEVKDEKDAGLLGKRVAVLAYKTCGVCEPCRTQRENLCENTEHLGHGAGWGEMEFYPGGMAEYCQVWSSHVFPISDSLSFEEACTWDFMGVSLAAVNHAPKLFAQDVLVIGAGPVGLGIVQIAKLTGARRVFCVDVLDYTFQIAMDTGADACFNASGQDAVEPILRLTGNRGCGVVYDTVGTAETQRLGLNLLKTRGRLINVVCNGVQVPYQLKDLSGERSISSIANCRYSEYYDCLKMMEAGRITVKPMLTDILPLEQVHEGFKRLQTRETTGAVKVVLKP